MGISDLAITGSSWMDNRDYKDFRGGVDPKWGRGDPSYVPPVRTPQDELRSCRVFELRQLAKLKKIKGRSKMNRDHLIEALNTLVNETDFPL
jgi:hypothetical protein